MPHSKCNEVENVIIIAYISFIHLFVSFLIKYRQTYGGKKEKHDISGRVEANL